MYPDKGPGTEAEHKKDTLPLIKKVVASGEIQSEEINFATFMMQVIALEPRYKALKALFDKSVNKYHLEKDLSKRLEIVSKVRGMVIDFKKDYPKFISEGKPRYCIEEFETWLEGK